MITDDRIEYNSAYISLNLLDELDHFIGGYAKPTIEFLFTLNTFVESFIGSSSFYTSLDELNHLNLTAPAIFPNGRPILNMVAKEGGLKFVSGVVDNPGKEIYRASALTRSKKEAQQDFINSFGAKMPQRYFIKSDINYKVDRIPLITAKFDDNDFVVSEALNSSVDLISNLLDVAGSSSIQTTLPIYLYGEQLSALSRIPYSIQSLEKVAKIHETNVDELRKSLNYKFIPIPPFTNILLSQVSSVSEIPQKLMQLRADFHDLRAAFVELETNILDAANYKQQKDAYRQFESFWEAFNRKYLDKRHRILYGTLDVAEGGDIDKSINKVIGSNDLTDAFKELNSAKIAGNLLRKGVEFYRDKRIINRFKGITNIWELFQDSKGLGQQVKHFENLFGVRFTIAEIERVHQYVKNRITDIRKNID